MRKCETCGAENQGQNNFCTACMTRLPAKDRPTLKEIREQMRAIIDREPTPEQIAALADVLKRYS
jgi:uncharacterized membrane protein YvbJ